jgi:hypothetical protein
MEETKCNLYQFNQTDPFHIGNPYGGLPTNLASHVYTSLACALLLPGTYHKIAYVYKKANSSQQYCHGWKFSHISFIGSVAEPQGAASFGRIRSRNAMRLRLRRLQLQQWY